MFGLPEKVSIKIAKELVEEIQKLVDKSNGEFKNVEKYLEFVLTELLKEEEPKPVYSPEEEEEIKKRLRSLGYLG